MDYINWKNSASASDYTGDGKINSVDYYLLVKGVTSQYGTHEFGHGIKISGAKSVTISTMKIKNMIGDAIEISRSK